MPRRKKEPGSLTGSQHFKQPDIESDPEVQDVDSRVRENLKTKLQNTASTIVEGVTAVANTAQTIGSTVNTVGASFKTVRNAFTGGSSLVTENHQAALTQANAIASNYGVAEIDVKSLLGSDPYQADGDAPEMAAKEANAIKLKLAKQNNALDVRLEKIRQGRKVAAIATEQRRLIGDFVQLNTVGIETATKVVQNQVADTKYRTEQSKLEQTEELLIQQQIGTQGTINLTEGIRQEWQLKFQKQERSNERIRLDIEGAIADNERKRLEIEAKLIEA